MINIQYNRLKIILEKQYGYSLSDVEKLIRKIQSSSPNIKEALGKWMETGNLPDEPLNGVDIMALVAYREMNPITAFLYADWYRREPEVAYSLLATQYKDKELSHKDRASAQALESTLG